MTLFYDEEEVKRLIDNQNQNSNRTHDVGHDLRINTQSTKHKIAESPVVIVYSGLQLLTV